VTLGGLPGSSAVDTDNGACAVDFGVFGHRLALFMVLVFSVGTGFTAFPSPLTQSQSV